VCWLKTENRICFSYAPDMIACSATPSGLRLFEQTVSALAAGTCETTLHLSLSLDLKPAKHFAKDWSSLVGDFGIGFVDVALKRSRSILVHYAVDSE
jgi:hypothetical protein